MKFNAGEIASVIQKEIEDFSGQLQTSEVGRVVEVGDGIARVYGLASAMAGEMVEFSSGVRGQVFNLEENSVGVIILGDYLKIAEGDEVKLGQTITVQDFADVKSVIVTGTSKGKGFAGVMKRHNFKGGPGGHGSHFHRAPGSIGQASTPSRVFKGMKGPGHMGSETVTVKNLDIVKIDAEQNLLLVKGAVPGGKNALLTIRMA